MNKKFIDKLKDTGSFILCLGVLLGIAYFSGFLKGFAPSDFLDAYQRVVYNLSKNSKSAEDRAGILSTGNSTAKKSSSFSSYRPHTIPETVIRGVHSSGTWTNIFESDKKVVFYLYDPTGEDSSLSEEFHHKMTSYINNKDNRPYYNIFAYTTDAFKNMRTGAVGPSKICDSLEECNQQRMNASDYSNMAEFFKRCGRTVCIINPANEQYVILRDRNFGNAVYVLNDLREW